MKRRHCYSRAHYKHRSAAQTPWLERRGEKLLQGVRHVNAGKLSKKQPRLFTPPREAGQRSARPKKCTALKSISCPRSSFWRMQGAFSQLVRLCHVPWMRCSGTCATPCCKRENRLLRYACREQRCDLAGVQRLRSATLLRSLSTRKEAVRSTRPWTRKRNVCTGSYSHTNIQRNVRISGDGLEQ